MTKRELIDKLKDCPDDMPVLVDSFYSNYHPIVSITHFSRDDDAPNTCIILAGDVECTDDELENL